MVTGMSCMAFPAVVCNGGSLRNQCMGIKSFAEHVLSSLALQELLGFPNTHFQCVHQLWMSADRFSTSMPSGRQVSVEMGHVIKE